MFRTLRSARLLIVLFALLMLSCASDDATLPGTGPGEQQPAVGGDLVDSAMADVPVPAAAETASELVDEEGRVTQSYIINQSDFAGVQEFYAEELPANGWERDSVEELADGQRTQWTQQDRRLLVATLQQGDDVDLSLQLTAADATPPNVDTDY